MQAIIRIDTALTETKVDALLAMFPDGVPEALDCVLTNLADNVVSGDPISTVAADGVLDIVYPIDFCGALYDEVMATCRAFKVGFTH
ncbi:hypothetical protein AHY58_002105 [Salmonella enterica subsp. enterica]|nr:hypothetical protein [Salmonella enterica subsp. enterica serovar Mikawasima]